MGVDALDPCRSGTRADRSRMETDEDLNGWEGERGRGGRRVEMNGSAVGGGSTLTSKDINRSGGITYRMQPIGTAHRPLRRLIVHL